METIQNAEIIITKNLETLLKNPNVMIALKISLVLYASALAPRLPSMVQSTFSNTFVKITALALIAFLADVDFQLAIILSIIYVLGINVASGRGIFESYTNVQSPFFKDQRKYKTLLGSPVIVGNAKLIESSSDNYSGCENIKMDDLLSTFDNDSLKLQTTVMYAYKDLLDRLPHDSTAKEKLVSVAKSIGLPGNVKFNDYNAPFIATILLNHGFKISNTCQAPYGGDMINT
jgi:DNA polymerase III delta subunit